jgi:hypothetical protein
MPFNVLKSIIWLALSNFAFNSLALADLNSSLSQNYNTCNSYLEPEADDLAPVLSLLRNPNTLPKNAIKGILGYLKNQYFWSGEQKHKEWQELVHIYNRGRSTYWINAPYLKTQDGDIVCWGETRGHLLIFRKDGKIFTSFNPFRPNPSHRGSSYQIDWDDPTLN